MECLLCCYCRSPKSIIDKRDVAPISGINISEYQLPEQMDRQFNTLLQQFLDGIYYYIEHQSLRKRHQKIIAASNEKHSNTADEDTDVSCDCFDSITFYIRQENYKLCYVCEC